MNKHIPLSRHPKMGRGRLLGLVVLMFTSVITHASDVFVSEGEYGEISFSDAHVPGATRVEAPQQPFVGIAGEDHIDDMLRVAGELERSRLAREARRDDLRKEARSAQIASARAARDRQVVRNRVVYRDSLGFRQTRHYQGRVDRNRGVRDKRGSSAEEPRPQISKRFK